MLEKVQAERLCKHCLQVVPPVYTEDFCCSGCRQVYQIINSAGFADYYSFRDLEGKHSFDQAEIKDLSYEYLNDPDFQKVFVKNVAGDNDQQQIDFFLLGVQCAACVWLVEKLPEYLPGIIKAELNFSSSVVRIIYNSKEVNLQTIAATLNKIGYPPEPYSPAEEEEQRKKSRKLMLMQLGVAGFCAGNTMLLAVALYQGYFTGIGTGFKNLLHYISFALTLPAIFFSAQVFFKAAFASVRLGNLHIDFPISLGIIVGFLYSSFNMLLGKGEVYFDSICMLIFLLLVGRYLQKVAVEKAYKSSNLENLLLPLYARVASRDSSGAEQFTEKYLKSIKREDVIKVLSGEKIPVDGVVESAEGLVSNAFLTGESEAIRVSKGAKVFAGAENLSEDLIIRVSEDYYSSRIYKILSLTKNLSGKGSQSDLASSTQVNSLSSIFVAVVLSLTLLCFIYWLLVGSLEEAVLYSISLLIITCPCALGLAAPLVITRGIAQCAKENILIRNANFFELLMAAKSFYFDKTGTITTGNFEIIQQKFLAELNEEQLLQKIAILENAAQHHFKKAFKLNSALSYLPELQEIEQITGRGLRGIFNDSSELHLGSRDYLISLDIPLTTEAENIIELNNQQELTSVLVAVGNKVVAIFGLGDSVRNNFDQIFAELFKQQKKVSIISGDQKSVVRKISREINQRLTGDQKILDSDIYAGLLPEQKREIVASDDNLNCMIGDGVNDAPALKAASVSIGFGGSTEASLLVADCFIVKPGTAPLLFTLRSASKVNKLIRRNIVFSITYNVIGAGLAFTGYISPLLAAILMPISSFTVILSALCLRLNMPAK